MAGTALLGVVDWVSCLPSFATLYTYCCIDYCHRSLFPTGIRNGLFSRCQYSCLSSTIETVRFDLGPISFDKCSIDDFSSFCTLWWFYCNWSSKNKMGKAMRAVSVDSDAAQLMGINVNPHNQLLPLLWVQLLLVQQVSLIALYYNSLEPLMGVTPGLKSFVAAVLGGIGIIPGAALGDLWSACWKHLLLPSVCLISVMLSYMESCFWFWLFDLQVSLVRMWKRRCRQWRQILKVNIPLVIPSVSGLWID